MGCVASKHVTGEGVSGRGERKGSEKRERGEGVRRGERGDRDVKKGEEEAELVEKERRDGVKGKERELLVMRVEPIAVQLGTTVKEAG